MSPASHVGKVGSAYHGTHTLDLAGVPEFEGIREFYVHMRQSNGSGIRGNVSSRLDTLEIEAFYAE